MSSLHLSLHFRKQMHCCRCFRSFEFHRFVQFVVYCLTFLVLLHLHYTSYRRHADQVVPQQSSYKLWQDEEKLLSSFHSSCRNFLLSFLMHLSVVTKTWRVDFLLGCGRWPHRVMSRNIFPNSALGCSDDNSLQSGQILIVVVQTEEP